MTRRYPVYLDGVADYQPGDPEPEGYIEFHSWAAVQHQAGLRQSRCARCGLYRFPQELDGAATAAAGKSICRACSGAGGGER